MLTAAERADPTSPSLIVMMCAVLLVSTSGFYDWLRAPASERTRRRARVAVAVQLAFDKGRGTYGVRRVHRELGRHADPTAATTSVKLVRSLMRELDLHACQERPYKVTTEQDPTGPAGAVDLLARDEREQAVAATLNSRPRKTLDWQTPAEAFSEHLRSCSQADVATTPWT